MEVVDLNTVTTKNVHIDQLGREPIEIVCPCCQTVGVSDLRKEVVTCSQRCCWILDKLCCCCPISWFKQFDYNHYCGKCGCYIGRNIEVSWYKRQVFKCKRWEIEHADKWEIQA